MSTYPNPAQQRSYNDITTALRAQTGEVTLATPETPGQIDLTIQSPNQPVRITLNNDGQIAEIAFYDANEENCEPDGTITQGRWIDLEPDSAVAGALHEAVAAQNPAQPTARQLLNALSEKLLNLRDEGRPTTAAAAYERAASLVRATRDALPAEPGTPRNPEGGPETTAADHVAPAELRVMLGLPQLPFIPADEGLVDHVAGAFYLMAPERDHKHRVKAWSYASYEARTGHAGNARRVLNAIVNGEDPHGVSFARGPLTQRHVEAAESAYAAWRQEAA